MPGLLDSPGGGCPLPPQQLRFMGEDDQRFLDLGDLCLRMLEHARPLPTVHSILDVGSGYGRLAHALLRREAFSGVYYGLEILPRHVAWCQDNITPCGPYRFLHLDVHNARYNPTGKHRIFDVDFSEMPKVDVVCFFSVFTHLYEEEIRFYLREAGALLRPGGKVVGTAFLLNDSSRAGESVGTSRYPMPHRLNAHTRYFNEGDPLHAIGYEQAAFEGMVRDTGLVVEDVVLGSWCGRAPNEAFDPFQDLLIAGAPHRGRQPALEPG